VLKRCRSAEVHRFSGSEVQGWCRGAEVLVQVQRCRDAEMQRCRGAEVQRSCRGAAVQRFRDADEHAEVQVLSCRGAEVQMCRWLCRGDELLEEVQRC